MSALGGSGAPRLLLAGAFLASAALCVAHASRSNWGPDYWEHLSAVRELATRPAAPRHPQLALPVPSPYFSPYHLAVAAAARAGGAPPSTALPAFALLNAAFLAFALRRFAAAFADAPRAEWTAAVHALFILLLWGADPWSWSAFLHLRVVGRTLPYPATFAIAAALAATAEFALWADDRRPRRLASVLLAWTVVLLTHPTTALFLAAAIAGVAAARGGRKALAVNAAAAAAVGFGGALLAGAWPLFPFRSLLDGSQAAYYNAGSSVLYQDVFARCWPAVLLGGAGLARRWRRSPPDPLGLVAAALLALYAYAALGPGGWGRVLAHLMLLLQFAAADFVVATWPPRWEPRRTAAAAAALLLALLNLVPGAVGGVLRDEPTNLDPGLWAALPRLVDDDAVVLADPRLEALVPAFAGRVVAYRQSNYFVPDHAARRADVSAFFAPGAPCAARLAVARRWNARFVLLDRTGPVGPLDSGVARWGPAAYAGPRYVLIGPLTAAACR